MLMDNASELSGRDVIALQHNEIKMRCRGSALPPRKLPPAGCTKLMFVSAWVDYRKYFGGSLYHFARLNTYVKFSYRKKVWKGEGVLIIVVNRCQTCVHLKHDLLPLPFDLCACVTL